MWTVTGGEGDREGGAVGGREGGGERKTGRAA